jgi:ABC-type multidrug transport system ATPase subunit
MVASVVIEGLTKDYGSGHGIFDLDLEVQAGETFGFIGPNGAGKSTTIRMLMDFIRPTRGHATVCGLDCQRDTVAVKRMVGYVPGELADYPSYTGAAVIELLANLRGGVDAGVIAHLAEELEIDLSRKYHEYSHGNKQKITLIQAFMHQPSVLLLDEPTLGLDPLVQQKFQTLVRQAADRGATIFLSSHVLSEVEELCDRIAIITEGHLRSLGTLTTLRRRHIHRVDLLIAGSADEAELRRIPGLSDLKIQDHHVLCRMEGDFTPLLHVLDSAGIREIDSEEMSLEEVFLAQYSRTQTTA